MVSAGAYKESASTAIERLRQTVTTERELVQKILEEVNSNVDLMEDLVKHKWSKLLERRALLMTIEGIKDLPKTILAEEATKAAEETKEFAYGPYYINGLLKAIENDNTFNFRLAGSPGTEASSASASVIINLNKTAGTLNDYANAVIQARETILKNRKKTDQPKGAQGFFAQDPILASWFWAEKVYRPGRESGKVSRRVYDRKKRKYLKKDVTASKRTLYKQTIALRRSFFTKPAPWWELLDKGNAPGKLASDWDGEPYPTLKATHFVDKARKRINNILREQYYLHRNSLQDRIQKKIDKLTKKNKLMTDYALDLSNMVTNEAVFQAKIKTAEELLKGTFAGYEYDPQKLEMLARNIAMGEEVALRQSLGSDVRKSIRPVIKKFMELYE